MTHGGPNNLDYLEGFLTECERALSDDRSPVNAELRRRHRQIIAANVSNVIGDLGTPNDDGTVSLYPLQILSLLKRKPTP